MNRDEAYGLLARELAAYADLGRESLAQLVGRSFEHRATGADSAKYVIEIAVRAALDRDGTLIDGTIDAISSQRLERIEAAMFVGSSDGEENE